MTNAADKGAWRNRLKEIAPAVAALPPSLHAVNLLILNGEPDAARAATEEALAAGTIAPRGLLTLSDRARQLGETDVSFYFRRLAYATEMSNLGLDGEEHEAAVQFCLAADGLTAGTPAPPQAYFEKMFDRYAETYESRLQDQLSYRGPSIVHELLSTRLGAALDGRRILDLGCGSGLAGPLFRPNAKYLAGVDFSQEMVNHAREKAVYDDLWVGDFLAIHDRFGEPFDLIISIDVLVYLRNLDRFLGVCRKSLAANGLLAVTIEANDEEPYRLADNRRYVHSLDHLRREAEQESLQIDHSEETWLRFERGKPVRAYVVLLGPATTTSTKPSV